MSHSNRKIIFIIAGTLLVIGASLKVFDFKSAFWIFSAGALPVIILQLLSLSEHKNELYVVRRLHFIAFVASLFLGVAAYFMFTSSTMWVICILLYALISLYVSFRS